MARGETLENVFASHRVGVDPRPLFDATNVPKGVSICLGTSDEFFSTLDGATEFDVVFLDGFHTFDQTYRDLMNALRVCRYGFILIDDVVPDDGASALADHHQAIQERKLAGKPTAWSGDVFKVILALSEYHSSELNFCTIVDSEQPQTLLWRKTASDEVLPMESSRLAKLDALTYEEVFKSGVPDLFVPKEENEAMTWALSRSGGAYEARSS